MSQTDKHKIHGINNIQSNNNQIWNLSFSHSIHCTKYDYIHSERTILLVCNPKLTLQICPVCAKFIQIQSNTLAQNNAIRIKAAFMTLAQAKCCSFLFFLLKVGVFYKWRSNSILSLSSVHRKYPNLWKSRRHLFLYAKSWNFRRRTPADWTDEDEKEMTQMSHDESQFKPANQISV